MNTKTIIAIIVLVILAVVGLVFLKRPQGEVTPKLPAGSTPAIDFSIISDTTWIWEKTMVSATSTITPQQAGKFTLTLKSDTQVVGTTDCNSLNGMYMVGTDGVLTFGPMGMTKMFCEGSQEGVFVEMLSKVHGYEVAEDGMLSLILENNGGVMVFTEKKTIEAI